MENKIRHLEMIESIIERMGRNSFQLKGWAVTLVTLIGVFASQVSEKRILVVLIPLLAFWFLDSRYLQIEREYRDLYDYIRIKNEEDIDFNMSVDNIESSLQNRRSTSYWKCLFSVSEGLFYLYIFAAFLILYFLVK